MKPFAFPEMLARVHALLRRTQPSSKPEILRYSDLQLDTGTRLAKRAERQFELTAKEYDLLEYLMRNPRQVLTREQILDRVWGYDFGGESNVLEVYIRYLRQKTEAKPGIAPHPHCAQRGLRVARGMNQLLRLALVCLTLVACGASSGPKASTSTVALTPVAFLPTVTQAKEKRVLFINGDHIPDTGYPHSRVGIGDDGTQPESFSRLRTEVLENSLALKVDEFILTASNTVTSGLLSPYALVVLGSNGRVFAAPEVQALTNYFNAGGNILVYADFQYGPNNWASDNSFLGQFSVEVFPDNFQPTTTITDIVTTHPVMLGITAFATEGSSQFLIKANTLAQNQVLSKCSPLERPGCAVQAPEQAKIQPGDVVACTWVRTNANANNGKLAGTCDRNTFHNGPGVGTNIDQFNNRVYATNLFRWLTQP